MAVKLIVPPQFAATRPPPPGKPDGHQVVTSAPPTMRDWVRLDQEFKESQPQPQYS